MKKVKKKTGEMKILRYEVSSDGIGLLAYYGERDEEFYHIHSNELSALEKWIKERLFSTVKKTYEGLSMHDNNIVKVLSDLAINSPAGTEIETQLDCGLLMRVKV